MREDSMVTLDVNGNRVDLDVDPKMPLLWALRDCMGLTGTKYGCGRALCGACTVHIDDEAARSCSIMVGDAAGKTIVTIEGVTCSQVEDKSCPQAEPDPRAKAVLAAWRQLNVVQCGYCQSGQIMSAITLLKKIPKPTDEDIDLAMEGNICRCGTYQRIRKAISLAADMLDGKAP
jgi:isoquinoline 1-oxidoreductase alpha subunit